MADNRDSDSMKNPELKWFMNEELSDFTFVVDGQRVPVLKALLSVKSDVFHKMFTDGFKESTANEIAIEGTTFEAFKTFIRCIYTDELVLGSEDYQLVRDVCELADRYQVLKVMDKVGDRYKNMISMANIKSLYPIAFRFKIEGLIKALDDWIDKNFELWYRKNVSELRRLDVVTNGAFIATFAKKFIKLYNSSGKISCPSTVYGHPFTFISQFSNILKD